MWAKGARLVVIEIIKYVNALTKAMTGLESNPTPPASSYDILN